MENDSVVGFAFRAFELKMFDCHPKCYMFRVFIDCVGNSITFSLINKTILIFPISLQGIILVLLSLIASAAYFFKGENTGKESVCC